MQFPIFLPPVPPHPGPKHCGTGKPPSLVTQHNWAPSNAYPVRPPAVDAPAHPSCHGADGRSGPVASLVLKITSIFFLKQGKRQTQALGSAPAADYFFWYFLCSGSLAVGFGWWVFAGYGAFRQQPPPLFESGLQPPGGC